MKQFLSIFIIIFIGLLSASAQRNTYPLSGIKVEYKPVAGDSVHYSCTVQIILQDTANISKLHIEMGSQRGSSDLFQKQFAFDETGTFSDSTSYSRTGKKITLGLGHFERMAHFYGTVKVEKSDQSVTDPITFSR